MAIISVKPSLSTSTITGSVISTAPATSSQGRLSLHEFKILYQEYISNSMEYPHELKSFESFCKIFMSKAEKKNPQSINKNKLLLWKRTKGPKFETARNDVLNEKIYSCYLLYCNASNDKSLPVLLGDDSLRSSIPELKNFGVICGKDTALSERLQKEVPLTASLHQGGILCEKEWDITKNDIAMEGTISVGRDFYVFYPDQPIMAKDLWDAKENRLRVMGREILFLLAHGYETKTTKLGIGFCTPCQNKENSTPISLSKILARIKEIDSWDAFKKVLAKHKIPFDE